jgi:hypothetical protein
MTQTHIDKTLGAIENKINIINGEIRQISYEISKGSDESSHFFGSELHAELFNKREALIQQREDLNNAYMTICKNF